MLCVCIISLIVGIITLLAIATISYKVYKTAKECDGDLQTEIDTLNSVNDSLRSRCKLVEESFDEYKNRYPIKTKYKVSAKVYIVDNKKAFIGQIYEIHQNTAREISYTIKYTEGEKATPKTLVRSEKKVYSTLADAITCEKLISQ